jgi:hypothetical protein
VKILSLQFPKHWTFTDSDLWCKLKRWECFPQWGRGKVIRAPWSWDSTEESSVVGRRTSGLFLHVLHLYSYCLQWTQCLMSADFPAREALISYGPCLKMLHHSGVPRDILSCTYRDRWIGRGGSRCLPALTWLGLSVMLVAEERRERFTCLSAINDTEIIQWQTVTLSAKTLASSDVFDS